MANHSPPAGSERRVFPARLEILPETAAFVEAWCSGRGVGSGDVARLVLIVEELVTNTVMHGHDGVADAPGATVALTLIPHPRGIELVYEDLAPPYDPTPRLAAAYAPIDDEVEDRPIGGLGLRLVGQFAVAARYAYEDGSNRLWLVVGVTA
ncbi:MAG: ATP-binding protein [Casimicrobiaceae bacterium]